MFCQCFAWTLLFYKPTCLLLSLMLRSVPAHYCTQHSFKFFIAILYILFVTWSECLVRFLAKFLYSADVFISLPPTTPIAFPVRFPLIPELLVHMNGLYLFSLTMNFLAFVNLETHQATSQPGISFGVCFLLLMN